MREDTPGRGLLILSMVTLSLWSLATAIISGRFGDQVANGDT